MPTPTPIPLFASTQLTLLHEEHAAEVASSKLASTAATVSPSTRRTLQATGYALTGLILSQCRTGLGGRVVGEFAPDPAVASDDTRAADGTPRLGAHGIRVGDVVRVNDVAGPKKGGKDKEKEKEKDEKGVEGVVTRTGDRAVWIAFGRQGGSTSKEDDEAVEELWGKKVWAIKLANDVTYRRYVGLIVGITGLLTSG
jgi:DNA polymerase alpha-associated DNA helicase A